MEYITLNDLTQIGIFLVAFAAFIVKAVSFFYKKK